MFRTKVGGAFQLLAMAVFFGGLYLLLFKGGLSPETEEPIYWGKIFSPWFGVMIFIASFEAMYRPLRWGATRRPEYLPASALGMTASVILLAAIMAGVNRTLPPTIAAGLGGAALTLFAGTGISLVMAGKVARAKCRQEDQESLDQLRAVAYKNHQRMLAKNREEMAAWLRRMRGEFAEKVSVVVRTTDGRKTAVESLVIGLLIDAGFTVMVHGGHYAMVITIGTNRTGSGWADVRVIDDGDTVVGTKILPCLSAGEDGVAASLEIANAAVDILYIRGLLTPPTEKTQA